MRQSRHGVNAAICGFLLIFGLTQSSCSSGDSGGGMTTQSPQSAPPSNPPPPAGTVTITGSVSGTIIKAVRTDTGAVIAQTDTATLVNPPFPFTLSDLPLNVDIKVFFFSGGQTFYLYAGSPLTNVFKFQKGAVNDLGFVTMSGVRATAQNPPSDVILEPEDTSSPPPGVEPPPATLTVATPPPATGSIIVNFSVQSFTIGDQGQQHLHIQVDGGPTRHFFNGQSKKVLDDNGQLTNDVQWQDPSSFRLNGLSVGQHLINVKLATAANNEFTNSEANPPPVSVTINSAPPPPTLTIASPTPGSGSVTVPFTVQNFVIGGQGTPHLHIYLDGGTANHFFNAPTNQVLDGSGQAVANIIRQSDTSFQMTGLSNGNHAIRLALANVADQDLTNAEANPPIVNFSIQGPPGNPTLTINSPRQGDPPLSPGPVLVTFDIQDSPVPPSATQPKMHFYVDSDPIVYKFYDGPGVTETDALNSGVRYEDAHTHFVHRKSGNSIQLNALASGSHQVRFVLVDQSEAELTSTQIILAFSLAAGTSGDFSLQQVVGNLNFPVSMATTPDGRIFVNEKNTGNIRVVMPTATLPWQLQDAPFATLPVTSRASAGEEGLLGIAVDPNFSMNGFVYVYYTGVDTVNRVVRFTATTLNGDTVASNPTPTVIFDNIPAAGIHNGGILQFGPTDGMLYIFVGENGVSVDAQDLTSLHGKMLRIRPDGSIPSDNPFFNNPPAHPAIYSYGHRNSFGFTFHPHTGDLWETENGEADNDQINRIIAGGNYGWPNCTGICGLPQYIDPILTFPAPSLAPTGIVAFREDSVYPAQYFNNLLFADFINGDLHRVVLGGAMLDTFVSHSIACDCGLGGLFGVMHGLNVPGQDGYVYVTTSSGISRVVLNAP